VTTPSVSDPVVVDSSGWLEYLTEDEKFKLFLPYFEGGPTVLVPVIVLYEVRKILLLHQFRTLADVFVSEALRRPIISVDEQIALEAATVSIQHQLPMADALLYASARAWGALLVTSDAHFTGLDGVTLI
jgi:toxin FitB